MKINYAQQNTYSQLTEIVYDVIICASGFEDRSTYFYENIKKHIKYAPVKICLSFAVRDIFSKKKNDEIYSENGFVFITYEDKSINGLIDIFLALFTSLEKKNINVVIDYSCMTKLMYAAIIKCFHLLSNKFESANVYYVYSQALYCAPPTTKSNLLNHPIPLFPTVELTDKKIALIVCLGYDEGKAQGLIEYFQIESNDCYLFFTSKHSGEEYYKEVLDQNQYIFKKVPEENHFEYEIDNIPKALSLLESLCTYLLSNSYRVIIAPIGPKVFSLMSILLTLKYNELTIFRVSDGENGNPLNKIADPNKDFVVLEICYKEETIQH